MNLKRNKIFIIIFILMIIRVVYKVYVFNYKYDSWDNKKITVNICNVQKIKDDKVTYKVKYDKNYFLLICKTTDIDGNVGDRMEIISSKYDIEKYNNPYEFDYNKYLNSNNIVSTIYCNKVIKHYTNENTLLSILNYIRNNISQRLDKMLGIEYSNLAKSLMYGDDLLLDSSLKEKFRDIGIGHVLCVSGSHVLYLILSFETIFKSSKKKFLNIFILIYFYFLSFFKISLLRPMLMYIMSIVLKKLTYRQRSVITIVLILFINPYYIFNIGIIFSFLTIFSINVFYSLIKSWLEIHINTKNKVINYIIKSISITISSHVLIIPFELYYFQKISLISIFSNILIGFVINTLLYFIFFLYILIFIPVISKVLAVICKVLLFLIIKGVDIFSTINYFNVKLPKPSMFIMCIMYIIIFIYLYKKLIIVYFWKKRKIIKNVIAILNYICIFIVICWNINTLYFEKYVIYFNVGQGNMTLIHNNTQNIIVDIGSTKESIAGNIILNFLKAKSIDNVDLILLTHMHTDHINGLKNIVNSDIKIKRVGLVRPPKITDEYLQLKSILKEKNICIIELTQDDRIEIGKTSIDILSPPKNKWIKDIDILNSNSAIFLISRDNKNYLFMGDSTINTEKYILNTYLYNSKNIEIFNKLKNVYVYQVSHHGSNTSSYEKFLKEINVEHAIISAKKSVYGHPNQKVLDKFSKLNIDVIITEKNGAIKF